MSFPGALLEELHEELWKKVSAKTANRVSQKVIITSLKNMDVDQEGGTLNNPLQAGDTFRSSTFAPIERSTNPLSRSGDLHVTGQGILNLEKMLRTIGELWVIIGVRGFLIAHCFCHFFLSRSKQLLIFSDF